MNYELGQQIGLGGCGNDLISLVYNFACAINFNEHAHAQTLDMTSLVTQLVGLSYYARVNGISDDTTVSRNLVQQIWSLSTI